MEIIAALIIACSNLINMHEDINTQKALEAKKACIARVSECAEKVQFQSITMQLKCSKEVY